MGEDRDNVYRDHHFFMLIAVWVLLE
jgi:hypothetical protein